jgi:hydroxyacylglutathione hydrolase
MACPRSLALLVSAPFLALGCSGDDGGGGATTGPTTSGGTACAAAQCTGDGADDGISTGTPPTSTTAGGSSSGEPPASTGSNDSTGPAESSGSAGDSSTGEPAACEGELPEMWIDGTACGSEPDIQIHQYDPNTVILRQSLCTNFEGPFMYLLFGEDRVLMQDTGAGGVQIADAVYGVIDDWLAANGKDSIELIVTNSHAHGDHVQGNGQFAGQPNTQVVGATQAAVTAFFGIENWPNESASYDLGGRQIDIIPIPGHEANHIAIYDHATGWLMTGDTLYPGRLYISNFTQYVASIERLVDFTEALEVCRVMGTHVEMTNTPTVDFAFGATMHPDEHPLELTRDHLLELRDAVQAMNGTAVYEEHDDFIIYPL